jgi:RNA polymerase sigma-70 factor (ECF subfamily)
MIRKAFHGALGLGESNDAVFSKMYRQQRGYVVCAVRRTGLPQADVDDLTQEVFLIFYRKFRGLEEAASIKPLLKAIVLRVCANRRRRLSRAATCETLAMRGSELQDGEWRGGLPPDEAFAERERHLLVTRALDRLDRSKRELVVLAHVEELTMSEIAARTSIGRNTIASRLRLGRARLARSLRGLGRENAQFG